MTLPGTRGDAEEGALLAILRPGTPVREERSPLHREEALRDQVCRGTDREHRTLFTCSGKEQ